MGRQGDIYMTAWRLTFSLAAIALCASATITTSNARADQADDVDESSVAIIPLVSDNNFDEHGDRDRNGDREGDWNRDRDFDRDWHRHGYGSCYAYCDDVRDECLRHSYRGYDDDGHGGRGRDHRWDEHHGHNDAYRYCDQRFNYCLNSCRDSRWNGR